MQGKRFVLNSCICSKAHVLCSFKNCFRSFSIYIFQMKFEWNVNPIERSPRYVWILFSSTLFYINYQLCWALAFHTFNFQLFTFFGSNEKNKYQFQFLLKVPSNKYFRSPQDRIDSPNKRSNNSHKIINKKIFQPRNICALTYELKSWCARVGKLDD